MGEHGEGDKDHVQGGHSPTQASPAYVSISRCALRPFFQRVLNFSTKVSSSETNIFISHFWNNLDIFQHKLKWLFQSKANPLGVLFTILILLISDVQSSVIEQ